MWGSIRYVEHADEQYLSKPDYSTAGDVQGRGVVDRGDVHVHHEAMSALQVPGDDEPWPRCQLQVHHDTVLRALRAIVQVPHLPTKSLILLLLFFY